MTAGIRLAKPQQPVDALPQPKRRAGSFSWQDYNTEKQEYIRTHPDATEAQIQQECQRIAYEMGL